MTQTTMGHHSSRAGLQAERTHLSWTRVSLAFFINGVLLLTKVGFPLETFAMYEFMVGLAFALAVITSIIALRRKTTLSQRPLPSRLAAHRALLGLGIGALILSVQTLIIMIAHFIGITIF